MRHLAVSCWLLEYNILNKYQTLVPSDLRAPNHYCSRLQPNTLQNCLAQEPSFGISEQIEREPRRFPMANDRKVFDAPRIASDDQLTIRGATREETPQEDPNSPNAQIRAAIAQMSALGPNAEADYQMSLRRLASNPQEAVAAISDVYRRVSEDQYLSRWSLVQLLSDLRDPAALSAFENILSTPIPPEKAPQMNLYSTVGEEVMIRTTAIDGITQLAARGERQALELLLRYVQHDVFSIKRAAIQGYLQVAGPEGREQLLKTLPPQDHFILDIRQVDVQNVPQPRIEQAYQERDQPPPAELPRPTIEE